MDEQEQLDLALALSLQEEEEKGARKRIWFKAAKTRRHGHPVRLTCTDEKDSSSFQKPPLNGDLSDLQRNLLVQQLARSSSSERHSNNDNSAFNKKKLYNKVNRKEEDDDYPVNDAADRKEECIVNKMSALLLLSANGSAWHRPSRNPATKCKTKQNVDTRVPQVEKPSTVTQLVASNELDGIEVSREDNSEIIARSLQEKYDSEALGLEEQALLLSAEAELNSDPQSDQHCMKGQMVDDSEMVARALQEEYDAESRTIEEQTRLLIAEQRNENTSGSSFSRHNDPARSGQRLSTNRPADHTMSGGDSFAIEFQRLFAPSPAEIPDIPRPPEDEFNSESFATTEDEDHHLITGANSSSSVIQQFDEDESAAFPNPDDLNYEEMLQLEDVSVGLSDQARSQLPAQTYKQNTKEKSKECTICMEKYVNGNLQKTLPCFHTFHSECIDHWLKRKAECPVCRMEVKI